MAQYSCLKFRNFARILVFQKATILMPKKSLSFSNPVLQKVLRLKEKDDYFCGTRGMTYLSNNLVTNKRTVESFMGIYVT